MIARVWRGWARHADADAYERYFRAVVTPELEAIPGFRGLILLRRDDGEETALMTMTYFGSMEAIERFAGSDRSRAVVQEEARRLLTRFDQRAVHWRIVQGSWPDTVHYPGDS